MQKQATSLLVDALSAYLSSSSDEDGEEVKKEGTEKEVRSRQGHALVDMEKKKNTKKRARARKSLPSFGSVMAKEHLSLGKRKLPAPSAKVGISTEARDGKVAKVARMHKANQRVRAFEHVDGSWASHVYIHVQPDVSIKEGDEGAEDSSAENDEDGKRLIIGSWLHRHIASLVATLSDGSGIPLTPMSANRSSIAGEGHRQGSFASHLHVSLSRTVQLRYHILEPLEKALKEEVSSIPAFLVGIPITLENVVLLCSDTSAQSTTHKQITNSVKPMATTFVGLRVSDVAGGEEMDLLVSAVDSVLARFNCATYYASRIFHCSVAWASGDKKEALQATCNRLVDSESSDGSDKRRADRLGEAEEGYISMEVECIYLRMGNRRIRLPLMK